MNSILFVKGTDVCTELLNRLPPSIKPFIRIYNVDEVGGLMTAMVYKIHTYPTLVTPDEKVTSINGIIDTLERMAVKMGDMPPFKR